MLAPGVGARGCAPSPPGSSPTWHQPAAPSALQDGRPLARAGWSPPPRRPRLQPPALAPPGLLRLLRLASSPPAQVALAARGGWPPGSRHRPDLPWPWRRPPPALWPPPPPALAPPPWPGPPPARTRRLGHRPMPAPRHPPAPPAHSSLSPSGGRRPGPLAGRLRSCRLVRSARGMGPETWGWELCAAKQAKLRNLQKRKKNDRGSASKALTRTPLGAPSGPSGLAPC
jgi:hypothetical protein